MKCTTFFLNKIRICDTQNEIPLKNYINLQFREKVRIAKCKLGIARNKVIVCYKLTIMKKSKLRDINMQFLEKQ